MATTACLGFPRIGAHRELKKALESYWTGASTRDSLLATGRSIRLDGWKRQQSAGITRVACGDFHFYDQVLTHSVTLGCIPARYAAVAAQGDALAVQFAMARGHQNEGIDVIACEMTKWFDTNYHYIVPEFTVDTEFNLLAEPPVVADFKEATSQGFAARPVVLGPVTYLTLGKMKDASSPDDALSVLLPKLLPAYVKLLQQLKAAGAEDVQIDEPVLVLDLTPAQKDAYVTAFTALAAAGQKMTLATYFGGLRDNAELAFSLEGVASVHIDVCREAQLAVAFEHLRPGQSLSLGVVDGRNVWKNDHAQSLLVLRAAVKRLGADRIVVAPSCSLLHTPVDLASEPQLDPEIAQWMAFAQQKLEEVSLLARALNDATSVAAVLDANAAVMSSRRNSTRIHRPAAKARLESVQACDMERQSPFSTRIGEQNRRLQLPLLPTTTIGSFPQTVEVRKARASFKAGSMSSAEYQAFLEKVTAECVRVQEDLGLDVLVHGEFERNDMVEYFGEQLSGFVFTANGWTQSYGSRCVKPPVIFGDVERPVPMTVAWAKYAQAQTRLPMKGMITGPVTILQWSFVRDDQPREITCKQIALAMRDEVLDLEAAGIAIIQIDEAALREGLPLRAADKPAYLRWAVDAFRLTASGVRDDTQIHTHMCYSDFNDIMAAVADMDADVISIETSRSAMKLLDSFVDFKYPNQIGPGVYDIHSPRVPTEAEMVSLLTRALTVLKAEQVWVNPDCGLKTRGWKEVVPALRAVVTTAQQARLQLKA